MRSGVAVDNVCSAGMIKFQEACDPIMCCEMSPQDVPSWARRCSSGALSGELVIDALTAQGVESILNVQREEEKAVEVEAPACAFKDGFDE